jgi:hypothetical protein
MKNAAIAIGSVLLLALAFFVGAASGYAEERTEAAASNGTRIALALLAMDKGQPDFAKDVLESSIDSSLMDYRSFTGGLRPIWASLGVGQPPSIRQVANYRAEFPSRSPDHEVRVRMNRLALDLQ